VLIEIPKVKERSGRGLRRTYSPKDRWERLERRSPLSDWVEKESSRLMTMYYKL